MIRRIELVNFMSHARTVIEPADGLTVLVGPNNCGKSAVVTALQILCHNDNSTYVTRHNERECSVTVETSDGHTVQWTRKNNSPRYTIDGQVFDRLDRNSIPADLHAVLCLPKVTAEGNREFDVHFGEQKSPVFLLDKPGSHAAQFFASSSDAAKLVEMQKRHQQKMAEARKERVQLGAQAEQLDRDLSILSVADAIGVLVAGAESQHASIAELFSTIAHAQSEIQDLEQASGALSQRDAETTALAPLRPPPALEPTDALVDLIGALGQTGREWDRNGRQASSLANLRPTPDLDDEGELDGVIGQLRSAQREAQRLDTECRVSGGLVAPPELADTETLSDLVGELAELNQRVAIAQSRATAIGLLPTPPDLAPVTDLAADLATFRRVTADLDRAHVAYERLAALQMPVVLADPAELTRLVGDMDDAAGEIATHEKSVTSAGEELRTAEGNLRRWAKEQRICPTCGGTLDPSRVLAHARTHVGGDTHD